jgi:hypothetical protein|tara:strand:- start:132 stop:494 length:363 start_codon:yes stop_codon:yes gene_type:complete
MNQKLTRQESHNLAMNLVGEELEKDGYEFLAINSDLKKNPQFVVLKNKETFFVVVRHVSSSVQLNNYTHINTKPILEHAIKHNAKVYYAGVLLGHGLDINLPVINGENYSFVYKGLIEIK